MRRRISSRDYYRRRVPLSLAKSSNETEGTRTSVFEILQICCRMILLLYYQRVKYATRYVRGSMIEYRCFEPQYSRVRKHAPDCFPICICLIFFCTVFAKTIFNHHALSRTIQKHAHQRFGRTIRRKSRFVDCRYTFTARGMNEAVEHTQSDRHLAHHLEQYSAEIEPSQRLLA